MPANSGMDMSADTIIELSSHPNIIGMKDSGGNIVRLAEGKSIIVESGGDISITAESGTISIKGMDVAIEATNELKLNGGMNLTSEAGMQHTTKGAMVSAESSGPHTIKGTPVQIN